jgi:hypothetical protein
VTLVILYPFLYGMCVHLILGHTYYEHSGLAKKTGCDMLSQEGHPIAYFNKGLSATNQKLSTYEKRVFSYHDGCG